MGKRLTDLEESSQRREHHPKGRHTAHTHHRRRERSPSVLSFPFFVDMHISDYESFVQS